MKFVSTKIVDDRRLSFSIPLEVVNIKDFTKEESSYVTFSYDIEDYAYPAIQCYRVQLLMRIKD